MKRSSRWRRRLGGFLLLIMALLALAGVSALVIRFAPPWLVSTKGLSGTTRLDELSRVRVALLVLVIGAFAAAVALYLWRRSVRDRHDESRERQLTERFMRAIDQLGHPAMDVRLGGIYSLERIARESRENHGPIIEILAAFVREQAQWPAQAGGHAEARVRPATDVQAGLTIIGRRVLAHDTDAPISLAYTRLAGATLTGAHLERALLTGSNLEGADLFKTHLDAADLEGANLGGAGLLLASLNDTVLWGANLEGARLYGANLEGAALKGANLKDAGLTGANLKDTGLHGAILTGADLTGANLEGAGLEGANLEGANLQGANVRGAVLLGALYDDATTWPNGFDAAAQGAVRRAWPQEAAPWAHEAEEGVHPPAGGWPHEAPETHATHAEPGTHAEPETYPERETHPEPETHAEPETTGGPETNAGWPQTPAPAPASAWPHEAGSEEPSPAAEIEPEPPSAWPPPSNDDPAPPDR